jgi:hypothetical protein
MNPAVTLEPRGRGRAPISLRLWRFSVSLSVYECKDPAVIV